MLWCIVEEKDGASFVLYTVEIYSIIACTSWQYSLATIIFSFFLTDSNFWISTKALKRLKITSCTPFNCPPPPLQTPPLATPPAPRYEHITAHTLTLALSSRADTHLIFPLRLMEDKNELHYKKDYVMESKTPRN